jgi:hypothetical protein
MRAIYRDNSRVVYRGRIFGLPVTLSIAKPSMIAAVYVGQAARPLFHMHPAAPLSHLTRWERPMQCAFREQQARTPLTLIGD